MCHLLPAKSLTHVVVNRGSLGEGTADVRVMEGRGGSQARKENEETKQNTLMESSIFIYMHGHIWNETK